MNKFYNLRAWLFDMLFYIRMFDRRYFDIRMFDMPVLEYQDVWYAFF